MRFCSSAGRRGSLLMFSAPKYYGNEFLSH